MRLFSLLALVAALIASAAGFPQVETTITTQCGPINAVLVKRVMPIYPAVARAKWIQGTVIIRVVIDRNGVPTHLQVESGPNELVNASVDAVKQWRYKPILLNGKAVPADSVIKIRYVIPHKKSVSTNAKPN